MMRWILPAWLCVMSWAYLDTPFYRAYGHVNGPFFFIGCAIVALLLLLTGRSFRGMSRISLPLYVLFGIFIIRAAYAAPTPSLLFPASLITLLFYESARQWMLREEPQRLREILFNVFSILIGAQLIYLCFYVWMMDGQVLRAAFPNSSIYAEALAMQLMFYAGLPGSGAKGWIQRILIAGSWLFLILLNGRAAWAGTGISFYLLMYQRYPGFRSKRVILLTCLAFVCSFLFLIRYKAHSTEGRALIYTVTLNLLKRYGWFGTGPGHFANGYQLAQAEHFRDHDINSAEAMRAGDTVYAFNEYLQWWAETGLIPMILLVFFLTVLFRSGLKSSDLLASAALAALLCTFVTAQFSYPLHFPPVLLFCLFCIACIDVAACREHVQIVSMGKMKFLLIITAGCFAMVCFYRQWLNLDLSRQAFLFNASGEKRKALSVYQQLEKDPYSSGRTIAAYAKLVWEMADTLRALELIQTAQQGTTDAELSYLSGTVHEAAGLNDRALAEYQQAVRMFPARIRYRMACFRFWQKRNDPETAAYWAGMVLDCPFPDLTPYIIKVRAEARQYLAKNGSFRAELGQN